MKRILNFLKELLFITGIMFLFSCANIVTPSGGPSDRTPPVAIKSEPAAWSSGFTGSRISIRFDEFVTVADPANQIVISPPVKEMPEFLLKGKSVIIDFAEKLADSTTYTIYFGNAIQDVNESNILQNFQYVFSTGSHIDSMSIRGSILNAYTKAAEKGIYVMLYRQNEDSLPYKKTPDYICKTNESGLFEVNNIAGGRYKIFALKDVNSNFIYDQPNEQIAFCDTLVTAQYVPVVRTDTASQKPGKKDSIAKKKEDSIRAAQPTVVINLINMLLFEERDTLQKIIKAKADKIGRVDIIFRKTVTDLNIRVLNKNPDSDWKTDEFNASKDTLICWLKNAEADTLKLEISDAGKILDTVELYTKSKSIKPTPRNKTGKGSADNETGFALTCIPGYGSSGLQRYFQPLMLVFNHPLNSYNFPNIILKEKKDSVFHAVTPELLFADSLSKRKLLVKYAWKKKTAYELYIPPGSFTDIFGLQNDTIKFKFTTTSPETYGTLKLKIKISDHRYPYMVQVVAEDGKLQAEQRIQTEGTLSLEYLLPGKYGVRAFCDRNNNGKWDTGNYLQKQKPEDVYYDPSAITIKANWDTDQKWEL